MRVKKVRTHVVTPGQSKKESSGAFSSRVSHIVVYRIVRAPIFTRKVAHEKAEKGTPVPFLATSTAILYISTKSTISFNKCVLSRASCPRRVCVALYDNTSGVIKFVRVTEMFSCPGFLRGICRYSTSMFPRADPHSGSPHFGRNLLPYGIPAWPFFPLC